MSQTGQNAFGDVGPQSSLLGNPPPSDTKFWYVKLALAFIVIMLVFVTLVKSFFPYGGSSLGLNIFFSICIILLCLSTIMLVVWYRQQDVSSTRLNLVIFANLLIIILFCICANLFQHGY